MKENENGFWSHAKAKIAIAASAIGLLLVPLKNLPQEAVALNRATVTSSAQIPRGGAFKRLFKSLPKEYRAPKAYPKGKRTFDFNKFNYIDDAVRLTDSSHLNFNRTQPRFPNTNGTRAYPNCIPNKSYDFKVHLYSMPTANYKLKNSSNQVLTIPIDTMRFNRKMENLKIEIDSSNNPSTE